MIIRSGFGVEDSLNRRFRMNNCKTDEYNELLGVKITEEIG